MANPILKSKFGEDASADAAPQSAETPITTRPAADRMTIGGTLRATGVLFVLLIGAAVFGWMNYESIGRSIILWSALGLFGLLIITMIRPQLVMITGPLYAVAEGVLVGAISRAYETFYEGIVLQAILATFAVFTAMLFLYAYRVIRVTQRMRSTIILATVGIALFYLISIVLNLFGVNIPFVWEGGIFSILISAGIIVVASLNLLLDFDMIENGIRDGADKLMNWFAAFGLMVTLVWLYLEILRLLSYLRD